MKIVLTGGGSGGHITPLLAVAHELKVLDPSAEIIYIGQKGDTLADIPAEDPNIGAVYTVSAGKFRRYAGEGWRQLLDVRAQVLNIRDAFRVVGGIWQSFWLIRRLKPQVIFTRGSFVSVPVALGGTLNRVPYITHDSDSIPGLVNRLLSHWAAVHAVALPVELYPYPPDKTVLTGVPVSARYQPVTEALRQQYRQELDLEGYEYVVCMTGGGNGSRTLNEALGRNARYLLGTFPGLALVHIAGRGLEQETNTAYDALQLGKARRRIMVRGFAADLYRYSGAADIVVARAGATNLAEFAIQAKACIIVPASQLSGGHQMRNTDVLVRRRAILRLTDDQVEQPERLGRAIGELLEDHEKRTALAHRLAAFAHPQAAAELAALVLMVGGGEVDVRAEK